EPARHLPRFLPLYSRLNFSLALFDLVYFCSALAWRSPSIFHLHLPHNPRRLLPPAPASTLPASICARRRRSRIWI
ncbi:hypothetical protein C8R44DRAFT_825018, partial [Mycena epipterygia]